VPDGEGSGGWHTTRNRPRLAGAYSTLTTVPHFFPVGTFGGATTGSDRSASVSAAVGVFRAGAAGVMNSTEYPGSTEVPLSSFGIAAAVLAKFVRSAWGFA